MTRNGAWERLASCSSNSCTCLLGSEVNSFSSEMWPHDLVPPASGNGMEAMLTDHLWGLAAQNLLFVLYILSSPGCSGVRDTRPLEATFWRSWGHWQLGSMSDLVELEWNCTSAGLLSLSLPYSEELGPAGRGCFGGPRFPSAFASMWRRPRALLNFVS